MRLRRNNALRSLGWLCLLALAALGCDSPEAAAQGGTEARTQAAPNQAQTPNQTQAPELAQLTDVSATNVGETLRQAPGRVLLVNLWSTWCAPCMEEMPMLVGVAERFRARGLGAAFISMDMTSNRDAALAFMREQHAPSPSYIRAGRDADFIRAIHSEWSGALPATILFNAQRQPVRFWAREVERAELESAIQALLTEEE